MSIMQILMAASPQPIRVIVSSNTRNINARTLALSNGYDGVSKLSLILTVNAGVIVGSTSTANPAIDFTGLPAGSSFVLNVGSGAYVVGAGGVGANGGGWDTSYYAPGGNGGDAIKTDNALTINNLGTIAGGGGGGGGGNGYSGDGFYGTTGGKGGDGAGDSAVGSATLTIGSNGITGEIAPDGRYKAGDGGKGGNLGVAGNAGEDKPANFNGSNPAPGAGGTAGKYMYGNSYVTWAAVGTRLGNVSA